jgi:hypothetical protein
LARQVNRFRGGWDTPLFSSVALQGVGRKWLIEHATLRRIKLGRRDQKAL